MSDERTKPKAIDAPPAPREAWRPPLIGSVNILEVSVGGRGAGKSMAQAARALQLQRELGAYVIVHSLGRRLPREIPSGSSLPFAGTKLKVDYHASIDDLDRGVRRHPERFQALAPALTAEGGRARDERDTADDLINYVIRLSTGIRRKAWHEAHPWRVWNADKADYNGLRARPIVLVIDEGIAVEGADKRASREMTQEFGQFLYSLRHFHVAMLWAIQEPNARSWKIIEAATATHVFQVRHEWALGAIRSSGASPDAMGDIARLDLYEFVTIPGGARALTPAQRAERARYERTRDIERALRAGGDKAVSVDDGEPTRTAGDPKVTAGTGEDGAAT